MLEAVGHPVAVNPDGPLGAIARERGWEVMTFETLGRRMKIAGAAGDRRRGRRRWVGDRLAPHPVAAVGLVEDAPAPLASRRGRTRS